LAEEKRKTRASIHATTTINFTSFPEKELAEIAPCLLKCNSTETVANATLLLNKKKNPDNLQVTCMSLSVVMLP